MLMGIYMCVNLGYYSQCMHHCAQDQERVLPTLRWRPRPELGGLMLQFFPSIESYCSVVPSAAVQIHLSHE